ncbi:fatty acid-binding protein, liver isoform X2 [Diabrotica virgifera virgifera]|uniref:Fatty acid-binding protein, liver-like n=1 Tax=Diabrotica virgifera virgifera TaxID=50390 RepID=A0A6P7F4W8_DIAVI|nr:fatty acid-binding protein, liver isoform X1 [Diabrotica virgifera virgifera]XP_050503321.1 fatty acid-binding protein, liver isoform X2 [Diabrotica virgifera virgifera]
MVLSGKYSVIGEENFVQYLKDYGIPEEQIKNSGQFSIEFKQDGNKVIVTESAAGKSKVTSFTLGEEFEEERFGHKIKSNAKLEGDILVITNGDHSRTFNFTSTGLEIVHKSPKGSAKLIFKKD